MVCKWCREEKKINCITDRAEEMCRQCFWLYNRLDEIQEGLKDGLIR